MRVERLNLKWLMAVGLLAAGACAEAPTEVAPPPDAAPPGPPPGYTQVVGSGPPRAIVVLEPIEPLDIPPPVEPAVMDQYGLAFIPGFLIVRAGQPVEFRNSEDEAHNIRVTDRETKDTLFNVAPPRSAKYTYTFDTPGYYDVLCDAHVGMFATVLVTESPYALVVGDEGSFTLPEVVSGSYRLIVTADGERSERVIDVSGDRLEIGLDDL